MDSQAKDQVKVRREGCRGVQQAASTSTAEDEAGTLHLTGTSPPLCSASRCPLPLHLLLYLLLVPLAPCTVSVIQDRRAGLRGQQNIARAGITGLHAFIGGIKLPDPARLGNRDSSGNL